MIRDIDVEVTEVKSAETEFDPVKMGFLAWECLVKVPGRPNKVEIIRGLTKGRVRRKSERRQKDLLQSYLADRGASKAQEPIVTEIPPKPEAISGIRSKDPGHEVGYSLKVIDPPADALGTNTPPPLPPHSTERGEDIIPDVPDSIVFYDPPKGKYNAASGEVDPIE